jgi:tetratricopeptide (TPR) repeat protein
MLSHLPLIQIGTERFELGGGALVALPFERYDELLLGSFTDARREYVATAPVFFESEKDGHLAACERVRDALALAAPASAIPDPELSLRLMDIPGDPPKTRTLQGDADQELLFLGLQACYLLSAEELERAAEMLDVVDRCDGELRQALDVLHDVADLSLTVTEQLTLCTIELEALLLPELDTELKRTFARRLANLTGCEEAVARALYDARSEAVHGEGGVEVQPGLAQCLLAGAVVALERLTRDGSALPELRARLDDDPVVSGPLTPGVPAPTPRMLHPLQRRSAPSSFGLALVGGLVLRDPEIGDGELVLFAPLIGLELDDLPDPLLEAGFPLSWLWPWQVGSFEDPDIRRDWMSRDSRTARVTGCLALRTRADFDFDAALAPLRQRVDTAVTALRLAGLAIVQDPELLGVYAHDGSGGRHRHPSVYRQTVFGLNFERPDALEPAVADLAALWPLLLAYEAGPRAPEIDHALALFRRAHFGFTLAAPTRLQLLFASFEAALGRIRRDEGDPLARLADGPQADAFAWHAAHGHRVRNALAHGEWEGDSAEAIRHMRAMLCEVLPALLMAWRRRGKARPAKTLLAALRDPASELDWRTVALDADLAAAREQRYAGQDTELLIERGRITGEPRWYARASELGDVRGEFFLGLIARDAGNLDGAVARLERALAGGLGAALVPLGQVERNRGNTDVARAHLRRAIELGEDDAILSLGILERAAGNIEQARKLYRRAADDGSAGGAYNLGLLEEREGNLAQALRWHVAAAEAGHVDAMGWAGDLSERSGDHEAALRWWRLAAEQGDANSAGQLGEAALQASDYAQARTWFEQAAAAGSEQAEQRLAQLAQHGL